MQPLVACLLLIASSSLVFADESQKKNLWERYKHPTNQFNTAKPSDALRPGCTDMGNCLGRDHMTNPRVRPTPDNPTPGRPMPGER